MMNEALCQQLYPAGPKRQLLACLPIRLSRDSNSQKKGDGRRAGFKVGKYPDISTIPPCIPFTTN